MGPQLMPVADARGRLGEGIRAYAVSRVDLLTPPAFLRVSELLGEGVGDSKSVGIAENRAFLDQVPEEDEHQRAIVVRAAQRLVLVLDEFAIDVGDVLFGRIVGE